MSNLIRTKQVGDILVIYIQPKRLTDDLDIYEVFTAVLQKIDEGNDRLILNFGTVEFLSSSALGKMVSVNKRIKKESGSLALCSIRPTIWKAFELTGLNKQFQQFDDETEALANI